MEPEHILKTAIVMPFRLSQYVRVPFGLQNARFDILEMITIGKGQQFKSKLFYKFL